MFEFEAKIWIYSGKGARHFVTVPQEISTKIREVQTSPLYKSKRGSRLKVSARIAYVTRETELFWNSKSLQYILTIKASIRKELKLQEGDNIYVHIDII